MNVDPQHTATLGDRLETDILGGQNVGLRSVLVLTGVTDEAMLAASSIQPDWVFESIHELATAWDALFP
jgi:ribonucleotide monophosphatase NagD (HAD superfamily)